MALYERCTIKIILCFLLSSQFLLGEEALVQELPLSSEKLESKELGKWHVAYLAKTGKIIKAVDTYFEEARLQDEHDFEVLQQLGSVLLEQGARSENPEKQLASIYGARLAGIASPLDVMEEGVRSQNPETQLACIQSIASFQDDRCDDLLLKAMSSPYLPIRLEAGYYLSLRKHPSATGQLEALLTRVPPFFHFVFPEFFAVIGTKESMSILRTLMDDEEISCRAEAILSAGRHGRDDLLTAIRKKASYPHHALQEASVIALMLLQDTSSLPRFKQLTKSSSSFVRLAALKALVQLGDEEAKEDLKALIKEADLYAIQIGGEFEVGLDHLADLTHHEDFQVRLNAAIALMGARDARALPALFEILIRDARDLGIVMTMSPGRSLFSWKAVPSLRQRQAMESADLYAISLAVREQFLRECLELGEKPFLRVAKEIFDRGQGELIPLLCTLLETLRTNSAIALLQENANRVGFPLIRTYAALSLYRIGAIGPYEGLLKQWLANHSKEELLRFRPLLPFHKRPVSTHYELSPEETSRLAIEIYHAFANRHTKEAIDLILKAIREDRSNNRYALAGLLLHALQ